MQTFELTILGCSSATPTSRRNPTSLLLNIADQYLLIDCGEATQIQLRKFKIKFQRIDHIFISHLHGDHYLGLVGLLSSMHLLGRTTDMHIYSPSGLKEIVDVQHKHSHVKLHYNLFFHELTGTKSEIIFEDEKYTVETILLKHRIPCYGFLFKEKPLLRNIIKEQITHYQIPLSEIPKIKRGDDYLNPEGNWIKNEVLTTAPLPPRKFAYCSDTCYNESIIEQIRGVDMLYHEATFMQKMQERAKETFHSTTIEAGTIAKKAEVQKLIIGHYSARYKDLEPLLLETQSVFSNTVLAIEGEKYVCDKQA